MRQVKKSTQLLTALADDTGMERPMPMLRLGGLSFVLIMLWSSVALAYTSYIPTVLPGAPEGCFQSAYYWIDCSCTTAEDASCADPELALIPMGTTAGGEPHCCEYEASDAMTCASNWVNGLSTGSANDTCSCEEASAAADAAAEAAGIAPETGGSASDPDGDGIPTCDEGNTDPYSSDTDSDGIPDTYDESSDDQCTDATGAPTSSEYCFADSDGDGDGVDVTGGDGIWDEGDGEEGDVYQSCPDDSEASCPEGWVESAGDCNDADPDVNSSHAEACDGMDNNCDGEIDEGLEQELYCSDLDKDGHGDAASANTTCNAPPPNTTATCDDCLDSASSVYPGAAETCDGIDNNCDGDVDETKKRYCKDADGDGYGDPSTALHACEKPEGYTNCYSDECNDSDASVNGAASESCDGIDNNCNGTIDEGYSTQTWCADTDGDGHGGGEAVEACAPPPNGVYTNSCDDCNDADGNIYPGQVEYCNDFDDNCDGVPDSSTDSKTYYADGDGDGYGNPTVSIEVCDPGQEPPQSSTNGQDCDDSNSNVNPGMSEISCNATDDDCNSTTADHEEGCLCPSEIESSYWGCVQKVSDKYSGDCDTQGIRITRALKSCCVQMMQSLCDGEESGYTMEECSEATEIAFDSLCP